MRNFRTFNIAVEFYHKCKMLCLPAHLKSQLARAASSIALNLAEGYGKNTTGDQVKFYRIALGSTRECQAILMISELSSSTQWQLLDKLAAHLYNLIKKAR